MLQIIARTYLLKYFFFLNTKYSAMKKYVICILCLIVLSKAIAQQHNPYQVKRSLNWNGNTIGFLEYKPGNYNGASPTKYPLIIFLHGIGERGDGDSELP